MFKKIFKKKRSFINSNLILLCVLLITFGIIQAINPLQPLTNTSLFIKMPVLFGFPMIFLGVSLLIDVIALIILSKLGVHEKLITKFKKVILYVLLVILSFYFIEYIVLGTVRIFQVAKTYPKKTMPPKEQFFVSTAWVVLVYGKDFLRGILMTIGISFAGTIIGLILGLLIAMLRVQKISNKDGEFKAFLKKIGLGFSKGYIAIFRGTPMMVQAILLYYLLPFAISQSFNISMSVMDKIFTAFVAGLITVSLNTTAYLAEVLRGSIEGVDNGQYEAARSLGFGYWKTMLHIILPQALKNSLPSIGNEFVINIKDTSVLNVITVTDIFFAATYVQDKTFRNTEGFFIAAVIYLILTFAISRILAFIDKKMDVKSKPLPSCN